MPHLILLALSFALFIVAAWVPSDPIWRRLVAGGLAVFVASMVGW